MADYRIFTVRGRTNLRVYDSNTAAIDAEVADEIKAFFTLRPILFSLIQDRPTLHLVNTYQCSVIGTYSVAVRKDNAELLAAVNASLAKLTARRMRDS